MVFHWSAGAEHGGGRYNPRGPVSWRGGSNGLTEACGYLVLMVLSHRAISKLAFWHCALTPSKRHAYMDLLIKEPISIAVISQERGWCQPESVNLTLRETLARSDMANGK